MITGFLEFKRELSQEILPLERIENFDEFHIPLEDTEQQLQGARCMDCGVPYCQNGMILCGMTSGCPLNNLIPEWNELVFYGTWELAFKRLMIKNRFPEFTSRVCPAPCEASCICGLTSGSPVTIRENEHAIIETAYAEGFMKAAVPPVRTGKNVAIIGSGPSGLCAAEWLNKRGHSVTVFERNDRIGGLLMYGIPNMKIEKHIIDRRINIMKAEGVEFRTNANVGDNVSSEELIHNFDSVILCCGASKPRDINVPGREANGIYFAVDYLTEVTKSVLDSDRPAYINACNKRVLVIGGGDTGNDCVGSAIRQSATAVYQLEMMPKPPVERAPDNPWPQYPRTLKTDYGQVESIAKFGEDPRIFQTTVKEFITDEYNNITAVVINKLDAIKDDETGRINMVPNGEEFTLEIDLVFIAAGFVGSENYVADAFGVELDNRGNVIADEFKTNIDNVFVSGDMHRGQSLVVWALREGKDVAREVDKHLMGYTNF
ncbi:MAG: glutamate synthase [Epulopiscium sp. Nele67-Bin002]|nr:MAG: glutamate synthase [Epulopiscium sp. Nuni2H_MBin001]OON92139.1 MAG: glutamate synthase [Epulopiscium sp. Nele67-Bin002]